MLYVCAVTRGQVGRRKGHQGRVGNRTGANRDKGMAKGDDEARNGMKRYGGKQQKHQEKEETGRK